MENVNDIVVAVVYIATLNLAVSGVLVLGLFKLWRFLEEEMPRRRRKAKQKEESS